MQKLITILMIFRRLKNVNNKTRFAGNVNTWSGLTNSSDREKVVLFFLPRLPQCKDESKVTFFQTLSINPSNSHLSFQAFALFLCSNVIDTRGPEH